MHKGRLSSVSRHTQVSCLAQGALVAVLRVFYDVSLERPSGLRAGWLAGSLSSVGGRGLALAAGPGSGPGDVTARGRRRHLSAATASVLH